MSLFSYEEETLFWRWLETAAYKEDMWDPSVREEREPACAYTSASVSTSDAGDEELPPF